MVKATCFKTITQCDSNNSFTPEFIFVLFEKRDNLDELINIPTKAEERSMIQSGIRSKIHSWSTIYRVFKIRESARFTQKSTIRALFKAKSVDPKNSSPSSLSDINTIIENIIIYQFFLPLDKPSQSSSMGMFKVTLSLEML